MQEKLADHLFTQRTVLRTGEGTTSYSKRDPCLQRAFRLNGQTPCAEKTSGSFGP